MNSISNTPTCNTRSSQSRGYSNWLTSILYKLLDKIEYGQLTIQEKDKVRTFGNDSTLRAHVTINDSRAYRKIVFAGLTHCQ